ncbi:hypothetical protein OWV82_006955 [Melia azedarach]|uniref:Uncharacterized protein n=1 Tax=Melia azedarach TaxID=155640 RepID=A0ACC1YKP2_MELAZ|nr:hypothetical protein OWV82_006955 [Melia azedarach]
MHRSAATDHPPPPPDTESESTENTPQTVQEPEISLKISSIAKIFLLASVEGLIASLGIRFSANKLLTENHRVLLTSGQICSVIGFLCCCGAYITETVYRRAIPGARLMAAVGAVATVCAFVLLGVVF